MGKYFLGKYRIGQVKIEKPAMKEGESKEDWMGRCIPYLIQEGKDKDTASGQCAGMYESKGIGKKFTLSTFKALEDFSLGKLEIKKGQELKYVLGVVLEPETIDATKTKDSVGDIYDEEEVRKAAHHFMMNYKGNGNDFMHDGKNNKDLKIVESYIAPADFSFDGQKVKKGTWMMGTLIFDDGIWKAVKEGKITGYSIGGTARGGIEHSKT